MDNESPLYLTVSVKEDTTSAWSADGAAPYRACYRSYQQAHVKGRSAESHMKTREYDAAVSCHEKASELLQQAMTLTRYAKALESLELQYHYHRKQSDIIKTKKLQHEIQLKVAELKKKKKMEKKTLTAAEQKDQELQWAILRTMEEADSLLERLHRRRNEEEDPVDVSPTSHEGFKHPKDDKTVMEELRTVNSQLRDLVSKLLSQLESSRKEVETLRARLKLYEDNGLPDLAPLELPHFDYSSL